MYVGSTSMYELFIYGVRNFAVPAALLRRSCGSLEDECEFAQIHCSAQPS